MVKKQLLCSRRRAGHAHQETGELNEDQTDREHVIVNNANEAPSELIPQIPAVNSSRAGTDTEDLQLMVRNPMNISDTVISCCTGLLRLLRRWFKVFITRDFCTLNKGLINKKELQLLTLGSNFAT